MRDRETIFFFLHQILRIVVCTRNENIERCINSMIVYVVDQTLISESRENHENIE